MHNAVLKFLMKWTDYAPALSMVELIVLLAWEMMLKCSFSLLKHFSIRSPCLVTILIVGACIK